MSGEMITALTALVVAVLSAGTALHGTRSGARLQRELSERQEAVDTAAEQLAAYTAYCTAATRFVGACRELAQELTPSTREPERCDSRYSAYEECWNRLADTQATARVRAARAGDRVIAQDLAQVVTRTTDLGDLVSTWYHDLRKRDWQPGGRRANGLDEAHGACLDAVRALEEEMIRLAGESRSPAGG